MSHYLPFDEMYSELLQLRADNERLRNELNIAGKAAEQLHRHNLELAAIINDITQGITN